MGIEALKILAIDDNQDNLTSLRAVLADAFPKAVVFTALNGWRGIEIALAEDPDVILLDIIMPGMDGFEVCRKLKADEHLHHIPVVFLTALKTDRKSRVRALEAGGEAFLSKPLEEEELIAQIRSMAKIKAMNVLHLQEKEQLSALVAERTEELERELSERRKTEQELRQANQSLQQSQIATLNLLEDLKDEIDERKKAEDEIHKRENLLNQIFDILPVGLWLADKNGSLFRTNEAGRRIWGAEPHVGQEEYGVFKARRLPSGKDIAPEDWALVHTINKGITVLDEQLEIFAFDGKKRYVLNSTAPVFDQNGNIEAAVIVNVDITERKQHEREMETVATLSAALRVAANSSEMAPVILEQLLSLLDVAGSLYAKQDPQSGDLIIEMGDGIWSSIPTGTIIPNGFELSKRFFGEGQPYLNNNAASDPYFSPKEQFGECVAVAGAPMVVNRIVIGLLCVASQHTLSDHDLRMLIAIADIAANAIHRATLHERTENQLSQLTALREIDQAITSNFDLDLTLNTLVALASAQLKADAVAVLLYDPQSQILEYASGYGFQYPDIRHTSLHLGEGQAGRAALENRTLVFLDMSNPKDGLSRIPLVEREGFVSHHATPLVSKGQLKGILEVFHRSKLESNPEWIGYLQAFAGQAAIAIDNVQLFEGLQFSNHELSLAYDATIEGWSRAMDLRDRETEGHTQRVTILTVQLARRMGISEDQIVHIRRGSLLHDIGKLGVPDTILLKPGKLTAEEWALMQQHPQYAYDMLSSIEYLRPALDISYCHHEKWDGTGYPRGLKEEEIPFTARMFSIIDVYDALTSDRPYRNAWSQEKALEYIREQDGKHFDPQVTQAFFSFLASDEWKRT